MRRVTLQDGGLWRGVRQAVFVGAPRRAARVWIGLLLEALCWPVLAGAPPASITVVLDDNYPPYVFRDASGQLQGLLVDSWALWQRKTGIEARLLAMDWGKAQAVMAARQADLIDTLFKTPERERLYLFSRPYADLDVVIAHDREIGGVGTPHTLRGFAVGVKDGDACISYLKARGVDQLRPYPSYQALIEAAGRDELKVFCIDRAPASHLLYEAGLNSRFRFSPPLYTGQFHRAVHRDSADLLVRVERGFEAFQPEERKEIERKWLGDEIDPPWRAYARHVVTGLWIAVGAMLLLVLWNLSLRRTVAARTADLVASERRYHSVFEMANDAILILAGPAVIDCNEKAVALYGLPREGLVGAHFDALAPSGQPTGQDSVLEAARRCEQALDGRPQNFVWQLRRGDGALVDTEATLSRFDTPNRPLLQVMLRDLTEARRAEAEITRLAYFDPLTQLPNRQQLYNRLAQALVEAGRHGTLGGVLLFDLDQFRTLNDTRGHREGDRLLAEVARRLADGVGREGFLARPGGDEFVVVMENLGHDPGTAATRVEALGQRLLASVAQPFHWPEFDHQCTASAGATLFRGFDESADELLKRADAAMYRAKHAGRSLFCFYDPAVQAALEARAALESELRQALPQDQLELHYQAQVDVGGRVVGAEALLRWRHPQRGLVEPGHFIAFAEESGLIVPIGHWVIETACARLAAWALRPETRDLYLSVNVSVRQFRQPDFVDQLRGVLAREAIAPGRLKLELTESLVLDNTAEAIDKMHAIRELGVGFAMDDFGTGYSSLSYLKRLPFDQLKIDQSFVRDLASDSNDAVIVRTIIGMADNLGLAVIAEGVETEAQRQFLLSHGCTGFQGYLFDRPRPAAEFEADLTGPARA